MCEKMKKRAIYKGKSVHNTQSAFTANTLRYAHICYGFEEEEKKTMRIAREKKNTLTHTA